MSEYDEHGQKKLDGPDATGALGLLLVPPAQVMAGIAVGFIHGAGWGAAALAALLLLDSALLIAASRAGRR